MKGGGTDLSSELHYEALIEAATGALVVTIEEILERHVALVLPPDGVAPQELLVPRLPELQAAQHANYCLLLGPHFGS